MGKTWESIFSQVLFETSLLSSKEKVNFTCFFDLGKIVLSQILKKCIPKNRLKTCIFVIRRLHEILERSRRYIAESRALQK